MKEAAEACYLVGLAAECAIKYHLSQMGFTYRARGRKKSASPDPVYLHFPELPQQILAQADGIVSGKILSRMSDKNLLNGWSVKMRYAKQLSDRTMNKRFELWKSQTVSLFAEVGL
ncbi:hypothetical protein [Sphingobium yanoikuyae]|uniref:hypothetical protein n=1 Tax=Sphingobium yanoikuyae TaxID=13690 RepID=UPI0028ADFA99|nr:hypothetical protein [Sphingobium yanoikuyae]